MTINGIIHTPYINKDGYLSTSFHLKKNKKKQQKNN